MNILEMSRKVLNFLVKRFIETFGLMISAVSIFLLAALLTYSPEDPNFIFPQNTEINNILGHRGSFISDLFFQSIGLISILIPLSFFIIGINIIKNKKPIIILPNSFFIILYCILGSIFFNIFYPVSFWLSINGNGGFLGKLLTSKHIIDIINLNKDISYFVQCSLSPHAVISSLHRQDESNHNICNQVPCQRRIQHDISLSSLQH